MSDSITPPEAPWPARVREFVHVEWVLILVLTYAVLLGVVGAIFFIFAEGQTLRMKTEPSLVWDTRGLIEIVFFVSQIGIALLAAVALSIARKHADHMKLRTEEATRARKATVYMEINSRYNSAPVTYSRLKLVYLMEIHASGTKPETVDAFVHTKLKEMYDQTYAKFNEAETTGEGEYTKSLRLLSFLEDIGVLVEKKYVEAEDLFDFMSGVIRFAENVLQHHIIWRREQTGSPSLYANALKLMQKAHAFSPSAFDEGVYRLNEVRASQ
jgi:hypothetical protein